MRRCRLGGDDAGSCQCFRSGDRRLDGVRVLCSLSMAVVLKEHEAYVFTKKQTLSLGDAETVRASLGLMFRATLSIASTTYFIPQGLAACLVRPALVR